MITPEPQTIYVVRGQYLDIVIPVTDDDGNDVDLTGYTVTFGIATSRKGAYIHTLSCDVSGNEITAHLTDEISELLVRRGYYYSCWVEVGGAPTPVALGTMEITDDSRNYA